MSLTYNISDIWTNVNMLWANLWPFIAIPMGILVGAIVVGLGINIFRGTFFDKFS